MNVILKFEGRDAIPVRAIPFLTNWEVLSPDELADALAGGEHGYAFHDIFAYRIEDSEVRPVVQTWWPSGDSLSVFARDCRAFVGQLQSALPDGYEIADEHTAKLISAAEGNEGAPLARGWTPPSM